MTDITELAQSLKAAANNAGADEWQAKKIGGDFYVIRKGSYKLEYGYRTYQPIAEIDDKPTRDYVAVASPANVLALIESLEKAQQRIAELESSTVKLPKLKMLEDYLAEVAIDERKQILVGVKLEFHRALTDAGIKVEAE
ncbi:ead/Ea22-like family protein [Klebsiella pneumoniae]|uniref:ead/Ea22-like family protein n=1 Tax=Klebsiella pneumoniae TaxID=573 RepID=UPI0027309AD4|nr:ead/Ea22-like family protein [Klebsiella pneumoniae]EKU2609819.1 ead/Ea22-like family protein [Klebsiella pneumoniae]EKU3918076.1 ead/Ea22-like family protein [Klebsiella pneumoniae]EKU3934664.1 ead/Ea22-like family protein [Klebsiella pneumoniae]EKX7974575.1 ead/Ea22-like family protein [Klebsiella pneumoniae]EKX9089311.1 ead/Ea22-like family protein [Klebsiella pneumoniae]